MKKKKKKNYEEEKSLSLRWSNYKTHKHTRAMIISMSSQGKYFIEEWEWSEKGSIAVLFEWSKQTEMSNEEE